MTETFVLEQNLSFGDYMRLMPIVMPRIRAFRRMFIYLACIGVFVGLITFGADRSTPLSTILMFFTPLLSLSGFLLIFLPPAIYLLLKFKPEAAKSVYRFSPAGLESTGGMANATLSISWLQFQKIKESKSFFLLYYKTNKVDSIIPVQKSSFPTKEAAAQFKVFFERNLLH